MQDANTAGAELGFSDRGCKLLMNCISTNVKPPFSWFQVKSFQKTAGANAPTAPTLTPPLQYRGLCGTIHVNLGPPRIRFQKLC